MKLKYFVTILTTLYISIKTADIPKSDSPIFPALTSSTLEQDEPFIGFIISLTSGQVQPLNKPNGCMLKFHYPEAVSPEEHNETTDHIKPKRFTLDNEDTLEYVIKRTGCDLEAARALLQKAHTEIDAITANQPTAENRLALQLMFYEKFPHKGLFRREGNKKIYALFQLNEFISSSNTPSRHKNFYEKLRGNASCSEIMEANISNNNAIDYTEKVTSIINFNEKYKIFIAECLLELSRIQQKALLIPSQTTQQSPSQDVELSGVTWPCCSCTAL